MTTMEEAVDQSSTGLRRHLFDRVADRQIQAADLYELKLWRADAPVGLWYKDFGSFRFVAKASSPRRSS